MENEAAVFKVLAEPTRLRLIPDILTVTGREVHALEPGTSLQDCIPAAWRDIPDTLGYLYEVERQER